MHLTLLIVPLLKSGVLEWLFSIVVKVWLRDSIGVPGFGSSFVLVQALGSSEDGSSDWFLLPTWDLETEFPAPNFAPTQSWPV